MLSTLKNSPFYGIDDIHLCSLLRGLELMNSGNIKDGYELFDHLSVSQDSKLSLLLEEYKRMGIVLQSKKNLSSADLLVSNKEYRKALRLYEKVEISVCRSDVAHQAHHNKGVCLAHLSLFEDALDELDMALKIDPDHAHTLQNKAVVLMMMEEYTLAVDCLQRLLSLMHIVDLKAPLVWFMKWECLIHLRRFVEAKDAAVLCLQLDFECKFQDKKLTDEMKSALEKFVEAEKAKDRNWLTVQGRSFLNPPEKSFEIRKHLHCAAFTFDRSVAHAVSTSPARIDSAPTPNCPVDCQDASSGSPVPDHYPIRWRKESSRRHSHSTAPPDLAAPVDVNGKKASFVGTKVVMTDTSARGANSVSDESSSSVSSITDVFPLGTLKNAAPSSHLIANSPVMLSRRYKIGEGKQLNRDPAVTLPEPHELVQGEDQCLDAVLVNVLGDAELINGSATDTMPTIVQSDALCLPHSQDAAIKVHSEALKVVDSGKDARSSSVSTAGLVRRASSIPRISRKLSKPTGSAPVSLQFTASVDSVDKEPVAVQTISTLRPLTRLPALSLNSRMITGVEDPALLYERSKSQLRVVRQSEGELNIDIAPEVFFDAGMLKHTDSPFLKSASEEARVTVPHWTQVEFEVPSLPVTPRGGVVPERGEGPKDVNDLPFYPLDRLKTSPYPKDVSVGYREYYLSEDDFKEVMGMTKEAWGRVPQWKKVVIKKRLGLF